MGALGRRQIGFEPEVNGVDEHSSSVSDKIHRVDIKHLGDVVGPFKAIPEPREITYHPGDASYKIPELPPVLVPDLLNGRRGRAPKLNSVAEGVADPLRPLLGKDRKSVV